MINDKMLDLDDLHILPSSMTISSGIDDYQMPEPCTNQKSIDLVNPFLDNCMFGYTSCSRSNLENKFNKFDYKNLSQNLYDEGSTSQNLNSDVIFQSIKNEYKSSENSSGNSSSKSAIIDVTVDPYIHRLMESLDDDYDYNQHQSHANFGKHSRYKENFDLYDTPKQIQRNDEVQDSCHVNLYDKHKTASDLTSEITPDVLAEIDMFISEHVLLQKKEPNFASDLSKLKSKLVDSDSVDNLISLLSQETVFNQNYKDILQKTQEKYTHKKNKIYDEVDRVNSNYNLLRMSSAKNNVKNSITYSGSGKMNSEVFDHASKANFVKTKSVSQNSVDLFAELISTTVTAPTKKSNESLHWTETNRYNFVSPLPTDLTKADRGAIAKIQSRQRIVTTKH